MNKNLKKATAGVVAMVGLVLSPVSWWNDIVVNFPLSYLMASPWALINRKFFLPAFIGSYWVTNILGLLLMHYGARGIIKDSPKLTKKELFKTAMFCVLYSLVIGVLVQKGILKFPQELLEKIK